jgi:hypothetical protein
MSLLCAPIVGQSVVVKKIGNNARRRSGVELYSTNIVETVGRFWFTLENEKNSRFSILTGKQDGKGYSPNHEVYSSFEQIDIEEERIFIAHQIKCASITNLRLGDLVRVRDIIFDGINIPYYKRMII